jgi:hypothetical protein
VAPPEHVGGPIGAIGGPSGAVGGPIAEGPRPFYSFFWYFCICDLLSSPPMQLPDIFAVHCGPEGLWSVRAPEADPYMPAVRVVAVIKPGSSICALQLLSRPALGSRRARKKCNRARASKLVC